MPCVIIFLPVIIINGFKERCLNMKCITQYGISIKPTMQLYSIYFISRCFSFTNNTVRSMYAENVRDVSKTEMNNMYLIDTRKIQSIKSNHIIYIAGSKADSVKLNLQRLAVKNH